MSKLNNNSSRNAAPGNANLFVRQFGIAAIRHYMTSSGAFAEAWFRFYPAHTPLLALAVVTAMVAAL